MLIIVCNFKQRDLQKLQVYCHLHQQRPNQNCQQPNGCSQPRANFHSCSYAESHVFCKNKRWNSDFDCLIGSCSELWALICREQVTERKEGKISMIIDFDCKMQRITDIVCQGRGTKLVMAKYILWKLEIVHITRWFENFSRYNVTPN